MGTFTLWRTWRSHDKVKGHLRSNCYSYFKTFFKLLLFEQVHFNYNQTWYIHVGALWEPSHYDALRGHMTRLKVIGGQIVIVISVNLFHILLLFEQVRFNYNQTWYIGALHDKVKGHWRSNCYSNFGFKTFFKFCSNRFASITTKLGSSIGTIKVHNGNLHVMTLFEVTWQGQRSLEVKLLQLFDVKLL